MPIETRDGDIYDVETGEAITSRATNPWLRSLADYLPMQGIIEGGLALGRLRRALTERRPRRLLTVEIRQDIADAWRLRKSDQGSGFVNSDETADWKVEVADVRAVLAREAAKARKDRLYEAVVLDVPQDVVESPATGNALRRLLSVPGARLVVANLQERPQVDGFLWYQLTDPATKLPIPAWCGDRWDPAAGIGTPVGVGMIRVPGEGWVRR